MNDRFKFRYFNKLSNKMVEPKNWQNVDAVFECLEQQVCFDENITPLPYNHVGNGLVFMQCTGLKDKNGKLIYESDIIVIPNQYPFYDYKNKEDMKQDLNFTEGEIKGESILNYIGIVEWIYSQWQYVYHCVNPKKQGISEGGNQGLNDFGFDETRNTCYEVIGNIYENPELLQECD